MTASVAWTLLVASIAWASSTPAMAQGGKATAQQLKSGDPAAIRQALDDLRVAGTRAQPMAPQVAEVLSRGLPLALTEAAIDTLGDIEAESTSPILAQYTRHRDVNVRRAAVKALVHTKGAPAVTALRRALSDKDPGVRGTAASGLGALGARDAVPDLFLALAHRVHEAAASIGQLCNPQQCDALTNQLGKIPFDVMVSGLEPVLFRAETTDDLRIKVLGRLRELGTAEVHKFLQDIQSRKTTKWSPRAKQALDQAVRATAGGVE